MAVAILTCSEQPTAHRQRVWEKDIGEGRDSPGQPWACHPVSMPASWTPAPEPRALLTDEAKKTYNFLFQMGRRSADTFLGLLNSAATN